MLQVRGVAQRPVPYADRSRAERVAELLRNSSATHIHVHTSALKKYEDEPPGMWERADYEGGRDDGEVGG